MRIANPSRRALPAALCGALLLLLIPAWSAAGAATCDGHHATIVGTPGNDVIVGKKASDVIYGGGGDDRISGGPNGNDLICGGPGNDSLQGGRGFDSLYGEGGDDTLSGSTGSDRLDGGAGDDRLSGEQGGDGLYGGGGEDSLVGAKGPDHLFGGTENDYIDGAQGSDTIDGGSGDDNLVGDKGNDSVDGGSGDDRLEGGPGDEKALDGGPGTDTIAGGAGSDKIDGGAGDGDIVRGDAGTDTLDGGPGGEDIVSYETATRGGIQVNLAANQAKGDGHDALGGFEDVVGSPQADTIVGDSSFNRLDGGVGDDTLTAGGGGGDAYGGPGTDDCSGFSAVSSCGPEASPPASSAYVIVNQGLAGSSLVIQGSESADDLKIGRQGEAWAISDNGPIFAGEGCINAGGSAVSCPGDAAQALVVVTGGDGGDSIAVDPSVPASAKVRINGNGGSDTIVGGSGDDVLEAGENYNSPDNGNDSLTGNGGSDVLYADPGADQLSGGQGDDLLVSSVATCQGHTYDGGPGNDTVSYARSNAALNVTLGGTGGPAGCATPDRVLADNESLEGSDGPDVLTGDNGDNSLLGHLGADTFIGKGGNDFVDALDGQRDKRIDCGGGDDELSKDGSDPAPSSC
jgi:Ca2+-binding RTX toxin-like protein